MEMALTGPVQPLKIAGAANFVDVVVGATGFVAQAQFRFHVCSSVFV